MSPPIPDPTKEAPPSWEGKLGEWDWRNVDDTGEEIGKVVLLLVWGSV